MSAAPDPSPGATYWPIVLSDWRRSDADVVVHLRGGARLGPGKVKSPGSASRGMPGQLAIGNRQQWDFDLAEVVAIEASAP